ncbi:hypothetical protein nbrc107697_00140 [Gordonia crocea]|uniref:Protein kinase domain-containing protein n=2 Tax=Gordonia crocea TaxID=589162 RepID=A0A7M4BQ14_9ACTN|nr:hypothetical protein nbrc107697_00140 [Gordonia crocea]
MVVEKSSLGSMVRLNAGNQATLYSVPSYRHPKIGTEVVFKEYKRSLLADHGAALANGLPLIVDYPDGLSEARRKDLLSVTVWPRDVVVDDGRLVGILMGRIQDPFWFEMRGKQLPFSLKMLCDAPTQIRKRGLAVPSRSDLVGLTIRLIYALHLIHDNDLVVGDLSGNNVVLTNPALFSGGFRVKFLDVDSFRLADSAPPIPQGDAGQWRTPETMAVEEEAAKIGGFRAEMLLAQGQVRTRSTDIFKLGLAIIRLFDETEDAALTYSIDDAAPRIRQAFPADAATLLLRMVTAAPDGRPTTRMLLQALMPKR